jgi:hypothetical protein
LYAPLKKLIIGAMIYLSGMGQLLLQQNQRARDTRGNVEIPPVDE